MFVLLELINGVNCDILRMWSRG